MIRRDFIEKGFPIGRRIPVICIDKDFKSHIANNSFDLARILNDNKIKNCHGVWIGKYDTDYFELDPDAYKKMPVPPEEHKYIDHADNITVYFKQGESGDKKFHNLAYYLPGQEEVRETQDENLYKYLIDSARQFKVQYDNS